MDALISSGLSSAPTGALVSVTATAVALPVYDTNSASMSNLAITVTSEANHPVGTASRSSSGSGSATASGAATTETGGAHRLSGAAALALGAAAFAAL